MSQIVKHRQAVVAAAASIRRPQSGPALRLSARGALRGPVPALLLASLACGSVSAAEFPAKPIRMVIPFAPGGSNDIVGRMVGQQLQERLGQPVIIDNRAGAGGVLGTEMVARAPGDGYTLLIVSVAHAFNPALYKLSYDSIKAFAPVAMVGSGPNVMVINPQLPVNSVKELIAYARANPGKLNLASAGIGSFQHLSGELFTRMAKIEMTHVPFKGGGPAMTDVIAGQSQVTIGSLIQMQGHIRSGRLKPLAVGSLKRNPTLPDLPSINEAGLPGYEAINWWGVVGPAALPQPVIARVNKEVNASLASPDMLKRLEGEGAVATPGTPAEFGKVIVAETARWGKVVREAGIKAE
ncbi:MAG: tripartite tricarboxylate transporter substrate binding protein [bacterium]|nr:tripartite tricarboxylate transporter substrate binding protein [Betaproteobacteria bacterium]